MKSSNLRRGILVLNACNNGDSILTKVCCSIIYYLSIWSIVLMEEKHFRLVSVSVLRTALYIGRKVVKARNKSGLEMV